MSKIVLKGYIIVPKSDLSEVKKELVTHIKLTRQEKGCLIFDIAQAENNIYRYNVYEEFTNRESFSNHQDRVQNSKWGKISSNVSRHYEVIEIE